MQINQLPTIPQAPANADVLAIEVNGVTYKVSKQELAEAIAENISPSDIGALPDSTVHVTAVKGDAEESFRSGYVILTPADIGALPTNGGQMTGDIDMGQSGATSGAKRILWRTTDGTLFYIRPYNNLFQIVRQTQDGSSNVIGFSSDGAVSMENPFNWRGALSVYSKAEVDAFVSTRMWSARGNIVKSASTGTALGYGKALVYFVGKTVVVEFEAKIITAGTGSNVYDIGIEVNNLQSINSSIPNFSVVNGGIIHYYNSDGTLDTTMEGYAGEATINTTENRWAFARLYNTSGNIGAWTDNRYTVGKIITGTVYGTL